MSKPQIINDRETLVHELISVQSALFTANNGELLEGAEHANEHLSNVLKAIVNLQPTIIFDKEGK